MGTFPVSRLNKETWVDRYGVMSPVGELETAHISRIINLLEKQSAQHHENYIVWLKKRQKDTKDKDQEKYAMYKGYQSMAEESPASVWIRKTVLYKALKKELDRRLTTKREVDYIDELANCVGRLSDKSFEDLMVIICDSFEVKDKQDFIVAELKKKYEEMLKELCEED